MLPAGELNINDCITFYVDFICLEVPMLPVEELKVNVCIMFYCVF